VRQVRSNLTDAPVSSQDQVHPTVPAVSHPYDVYGSVVIVGTNSVLTGAGPNA
jgi:hypothetical protein